MSNLIQESKVKRVRSFNTEEIESILGCHRVTQNYWQHWMPGCIFTDGIKAMVGLCNASWLVDMIFGYQIEPLVLDDEGMQRFQSWELIKIEDEGTFLQCVRGGKVKIKHELDHLYFPLANIKLFLVVRKLFHGAERVLFLRSEYRFRGGFFA